MGSSSSSIGGCCKSREGEAEGLEVGARLVAAKACARRGSQARTRAMIRNQHKQQRRQYEKHTGPLELANKNASASLRPLLMPAWQRLKCRSYKDRFYYFNSETGECQWEEPAAERRRGKRHACICNAYTNNAWRFNTP